MLIRYPLRRNDRTAHFDGQLPPPSPVRTAVPTRPYLGEQHHLPRLRRGNKDAHRLRRIAGSEVAPKHRMRADANLERDAVGGARRNVTIEARPNPEADGARLKATKIKRERGRRMSVD